MSNLIVMPDASGAFPGEEKILANYTGRQLALNIDKIKVFQTYKFYLGPNVPWATVPAEADMPAIRNAVLDGRLIDVTDSDKGLKFKDGDFSPVKEIEDPNLRRVFIGHGRVDNVLTDTRPLYIAIPQDAEEEARMLAEIEQHGRIDGIYKAQNQPDIALASGIQVSDVNYEPPIQDQERGCIARLKQGIRRRIRKVLKFALNRI